MPWMCWKWDITGYLMFALNSWGGRFQYTWTPQPHLSLRSRHRADIGNMFFPYPLPADRPKLQTFAGSIRLVNARDGIEDYEYFTICRRLTRRLASRSDQSAADRRLIDRSGALLVIPDALIASPYDWVDRGRPYLDRRRELARHILSLKARLPRR